MEMSENIVCTLLLGGLGNQMFQYAAGRSLSISKQATLCIDSAWFLDPKGATPRSFDLTKFPALSGDGLVIAPAMLGTSMRYAPESLLCRMVRRLVRGTRPYSNHYIVEDQTVSPVDFSALSCPLYLHGYWQSEVYFLDHVGDIKKDFRFPELVCDKAVTIAEKIQCAPESVSVHVRRGDYVADSVTKAWHGICDMDYYASAMAHIERFVSEPQYFVFSDEPEWCRIAFAACKRPLTVVDVHGAGDAIHDMHLMASCTHHIVANSSFSWWGAWLSRREGMVVAPQRWFAAPSLAHVNPSPARWVLI